MSDSTKSISSEPDRSGASTAEPLLSDALVATRNSVKLGAALAASWGIGLLGRLIVPRYLGPQMFGAFQFANYFTACFFILTLLGIDTYVRKEVSIRREHASDFFGGLLVLRLIISLATVAIMFLVIVATGKPAYVRRLILIFSAYQALGILNTTYEALLQAAFAVDELSVVNVLAKVIWAGGILTAAGLGAGAQAFAAALVFSEGFKAAALTHLVRGKTGLRFRVDMGCTRQVVLASLPYCVGGLTMTLYGAADVSLMAFLASDFEVGWYGAASALVGIALVLAPIITAVLSPMSSRAAARSEEEFNTLIRRVLEVVVSVLTPVALLAALCSDFLVAVIFGPAFAPAARSFRILCPVFLLSYLGLVAVIFLFRLERGWTVTAVSFGVLTLNLLLNWFAIPYGAGHLGAGGAGVASAWAWLASELCSVSLLLYLLASRAFDQRNLSVFAKTAAISAVVVICHQGLPNLMGARLVADAALYFGLVLGTKAVRLEEVAQFVKLAAGHREKEG